MRLFTEEEVNKIVWWACSMQKAEDYQMAGHNLLIEGAFIYSIDEINQMIGKRQELINQKNQFIKERDYESATVVRDGEKELDKILSSSDVQLLIGVENTLNNLCDTDDNISKTYSLKNILIDLQDHVE